MRSHAPSSLLGLSLVVAALSCASVGREQQRLVQPLCRGVSTAAPRVHAELGVVEAKDALRDGLRQTIERGDPKAIGTVLDSIRSQSPSVAYQAAAFLIVDPHGFSRREALLMADLYRATRGGADAVLEALWAVGDDTREYEAMIAIEQLGSHEDSVAVMAIACDAAWWLALVVPADSGYDDSRTFIAWDETLERKRQTLSETARLLNASVAFPADSLCALFCRSRD